MCCSASTARSGRGDLFFLRSQNTAPVLLHARPSGAFAAALPFAQDRYAYKRDYLLNSLGYSTDSECAIGSQHRKLL